MSRRFATRQKEMKMKKQLTLETDKKTAKEGEFIDIRWHCSMCPDSLMLILDSGYRTDRLVVSDSGSTRIALPNTKGRFHITIEARCGKKKTSEEVAVRVLNVRSNKQKAKSKVGRFKLWSEKMHAGWCVFCAQCKYWWLSQKKWQKALWIALLALWIGLLIFSISRPSANISSENNQTSFITEQV